MTKILDQLLGLHGTIVYLLVGLLVFAEDALFVGFVLPGDTSASRRYYATDLTEPFELEEGHLAVPAGPGAGREPLPEALAEFTVSTQEVPMT